MKIVLAFLLGICAFLFAAAAVWFYLATRTALEGHSQPDFVADRVAAIIIVMALGTALAASGRVYLNLRAVDKGFWYAVFIVVVVPYVSSFVFLVIAHFQLTSMQFTDAGEPVSPWGYLLICGLPIVIGFFAGEVTVNMFSKKDTKPETNDSQ